MRRRVRGCTVALSLLLFLSSGCQTAPGALSASLSWLPMPPLDGGPSLRGLAAVSASEAWVGGSGGVVAHTFDGGRSWQLHRPAGAEETELEIRDVAVPAPGRILALTAGPGEASRVYLSEDNGGSWREVVRNLHPDGFWDGFAFWDGEQGLLVGDPVEGRLTLLRTADGGASWEPLAEASRPAMAEGEYCFAASGTSLALQPGGFAWLVTGGSQARVLRSTNGGASWRAGPLPLVQGSQGAGAFSVAFRDAMHGVVVGGDYLAPDGREAVAAWTADGGRTWKAVPAAIGPRGYRSGVAWAAAEGRWWCVGPTGVEWSRDGRRWNAHGADGMHAVDAMWMSGSGGRTARRQD
jgi:photosystem II stability/assembly factor-like uncharacterized protein